MIVVELPVAHRLGREALRHDVRPWQQAQHQLARLRLAKVQGNAALGGVVAGEELAAVDARLTVLPRRPDAQHVEPRRRLDADDVRAVIGEILGSNRTNADPGEIENVNAFECVFSHNAEVYGKLLGLSN